MSESDSTLPQQQIPSVVIVAPGAVMLDMWLEILQRLDEVPSIQLTELKDAATAVAKWRPMALLVERDLFEFDAKEFDALARDVGAEVIVVDTASGKDAIAALVLPKLATALSKWRTLTGA